MTSKPLHRAGDEQPRAEWPPPTVDDLEADGELPVVWAVVALVALCSAFAGATVAVVIRVFF